MLPLSPSVATYYTGAEFYENTMRNLPRFLVRFAGKLIRHRRETQRAIDDFRPDIIVSTGQAEKFIFPLLHSHERGRRLVKIREIHFNSKYRFFRYNKLLARLVNFLDYGILSSAFDKVYLLTAQDKRENFPRRRRFSFMPNPITFDIDRKKNSESPRAKTVLAVGRLVPQKNFMSLLRIWAAIGKAADGWTLRIVGDGSEMQSLQQAARELGITGSVEFAGYSREIHEEMCKAQVFVMTSLYEGLPLALLEAAACRLPVVSYKTPYGPEDIIKDGETGMLVSYLDEDEFAGKLRLLMSDGALRQAMALNAEREAEAYRTEVIMRRWLREYERR